MSSAGVDAYGAAFRNTSITSDLHGAKRHVQHRNLGTTLEDEPLQRPSRGSPQKHMVNDPSIPAAGGPSYRPEKPQLKRSAGVGVGGQTHLAAEGALTVDEAAMYRSQLSANSGADGFVPSIPLRGRPAMKQLQAPGGTDHVVLGNDHVVYECGTKEAHFRLAQDDELRRAAASEHAAGGRAAPKPDVRPSACHPARLIDHAATVLQDGSNTGPGSFTYGLDEAQRRAALDPSAREQVARMEMAGKRVDRQSGIRVLASGPGGATHTSLAWDVDPHARPSTRPGSARLGTPSDSTPKVAVGGYSAPYLENSSTSAAGQDRVGSLLGQTGPAPTPDTHAYGRRAVPGAVAAATHLSSVFNHESGAVAAPLSPSRRAGVQPVGGRGVLVAGLHGLDALSPKVGARMPVHAQSQVVFG